MDNKVRSQRIKTLSRLNSFGFGVKENIGNDVKFKTCVCVRETERRQTKREEDQLIPHLIPLVIL